MAFRGALRNEPKGEIGVQTEHHHWFSPSLGREMELKVYGWQGRPVLVFPTSKGRFFQYEDSGMVEACAASLEAGRIKLFAVDGVDEESWYCEGAHPADKARRHQAYDAYILREAVPFIHHHCHIGPLPILTTGCSFGAYHAANFLLRHPEVFDGAICLSGIYRLDDFVGGYEDENVWSNDPLRYLPHVTDPAVLECYRRARIILCVGQGAWEEKCLDDTRALSAALHRLGVDHWCDLWGSDVNHDWPWWRRQMPYFLEKLGL
jgi:esterase/lipase superfamily enzyme